MIAKYLTFEIEFLNDCELPKWKGRIIRGFIGMILKNIYCKVKNVECERCSRNFLCPYGYLFRSTSPKFFLRNIKYFSKPLSMKPPLNQKKTFKAGEILTFSIVLFGKACNFIIDILNAVRYGNLLGIGKAGSRGKYKIRKVYLENPFRDSKEILIKGNEIVKSNLGIEFKDLERRIKKEFTIKFLTPVRIIKEGYFVTCPEFKDIFPFMMRKYSNILRAYCNIKLEEDFKELKDISTEIETISRNLKTVNFSYTKGNRVYREKYYFGEIKFYSPFIIPKDLRRIINFGMLSNIGKRTTFGHGWYIIL